MMRYSMRPFFQTRLVFSDKRRYICVLLCLTALVFGCDEYADAPVPVTARRGAISPESSARVWNGNDPFHQPAATTDYLGSGDANNDGAFTAEDVAYAGEMIGHPERWSSRADVNGDGVIDQADIDLMEDALAGTPLWGWWDALTTRQERERWVRIVLERDWTNERTYHDYFFCADFSIQLFRHAAFWRGDTLRSRSPQNQNGTTQSGSNTLFNIPMYRGSGGNHAFNAILVGDDPTNPRDWWIIEPQGDTPGITHLAVQPETFDIRVNEDDVKIRFTNVVVNPDGTFDADVEVVSPDFQLTRIAPVSRPIDNRMDRWNPKLLPMGDGAVFFEQTRDDMTRNMDIHASTLSDLDASPGEGLVDPTWFTRLLDVAKGPNGDIHLLWYEEAASFDPDVNDAVQLFYGTLDTSGGSVTTDGIPVGSAMAPPRKGVIRIGGSGEVHLFWYENPIWEPEGGVMWTMFDGTDWSAVENLTPRMCMSEDANAFLDWNNWINRDPLRYVFDADVTASGGIALLWRQNVCVSSEPCFIPDFNSCCSSDSRIYERRFDGAGWDSPVEVGDETNVRGVALATDAAGALHAMYWTGGAQTPNNEGRGPVRHRVSTDNGDSWGSASVVDPDPGAGHVDVVADEAGQVFAVWDREETTGQIVPVLGTYANGIWRNIDALAPLADEEVWYPEPAVLDTGKVAVLWSARSDALVDIDTEVRTVEAGDVDWDGAVTYDDAIRVSEYFTGLVVPPPFYASAADVDCDGVITVVDALTIARYVDGLIDTLACGAL